MEAYIDVLKFIQSDATLQKVIQLIALNEIEGLIQTSEYKIKGTKYRLISTNNGTVNFEMLDTFTFKIENLSINKEITFFRPVGYFGFDKPLVLAFTSLREFDVLSKMQDEVFKKSEKRINIYRGSKLILDAVIGCFSAEICLAARTYFDLMKWETIREIATSDSTLLTWTFNQSVKACGINYKLVTTPSFTTIFIYPMEGDELDVPLAAYTSKHEIMIIPKFKEVYERLLPFQVFTRDRI